MKSLYRFWNVISFILIKKKKKKKKKRDKSYNNIENRMCMCEQNGKEILFNFSTVRMISNHTYSQLF